MEDEELPSLDATVNHTLMGIHACLCGTSFYAIYYIPKNCYIALGCYHVMLTYGMIGIYRFVQGQRRYVAHEIVNAFHFFIRKCMFSLTTLQAIIILQWPKPLHLQCVVSILPLGLLAMENPRYINRLQIVIMTGNVLCSTLIFTYAGPIWGLHHCVWNYFFIRDSQVNPIILAFNNIIFLKYMTSVAEAAALAPLAHKPS